MAGMKDSARAVWESNAAISTAAVVAIAVMVNYLSARHFARLDWTRDAVYTVSEKTRSVVEALDDPVTLYVLWSQADPLYWHLEELLASYEELSSLVRVVFVDPDEDPEQFRLVQQRYGKLRTDAEGNAGLEAGVVVATADRSRFVAAEDMRSYGDLGDPDAEPRLDFAAESKITGALIAVVQDAKTTVCFTQGHGEWSLEGGAEGLTHVKRELELDGYAVVPLVLSEVGAVRGCDAVVVAGPKKAFRDAEAAALQRYFSRGGRLVLLLDPIVEGTRWVPTGLEALAAEAGIRLHQDVVVETDPRRLVSETPVTFVADRIVAHDAVKPLSKTVRGAPMPVVFSIARSMEVGREGDVIADSLVTASPVAFGETDLRGLTDGVVVPSQDPEDFEGPLTLAAAVATETAQGKVARMVVVGDSDLLAQQLFANAALYDRDFFSQVLAWVTQRRELVSIAAKHPEQVRLQLTSRDLGAMASSIAALLAAVVIAGVQVRRRRKR